MASNKSIIAFAGRNGCGKGTAAAHASAQLSAPTHTYSDVLYELHAVCGVPRAQVGRATLQELSTVVRRWFGQDCLARVMALKCEAETTSYVVIDGVRRMDDVRLLQEAYGEHFVLVWIEASADNRYERLKARKAKSGEEMMSREAFDAQEQAESERQLDLVREACRTTIGNDGPPEALVPQVEALVGALADFGPVAHG
jgi:dephospho-CoA kinase